MQLKANNSNRRKHKIIKNKEKYKVLKLRQIDSLPEYLLRGNYFQVSDRHGKSQDSFYACWEAVKTSSCVVCHS